MRYALSRLEESQQEKAYRIYVTDSLQLAAQNKYLTARYADIIKKDRVRDNRSGDEIASDVIKNAGLEINYA